MKTEASLLSEIAAAATFREQASLVGELDALRRTTANQIAQDREWDAAGTIVEQTLTPVLAHSFHTASTDWLSEADIPAVDANAVHAEASLWFGKTSAMVKADNEEFAEQAKGVARRLASQFGDAAPEAQRLFLDYVSFLHRREAASGLDQIQQTVDPNNKSKTTPLPTDVFDTFQDPIDPMNQGVDEAQSSYNAPLLNEILQEGAGQGQAEVMNGHGPGSGPSQNPNGGSGLNVGASLIDAPSVAHGYLYNLDDFIASQAAIQAQAGRETDDQEDHSSLTATASSDECDDCGGLMTGGSVKNPQCLNCRDDDDTKDSRDEEYSRGEHEASLSTEASEGTCPLCASSKCDHNITEAQLEKARSMPGGENKNLKKIVEGSQKEAASGLDQIEQVIDANNQPKATPMPQDVAFPLIPYFTNPHDHTLDAAKTSAKVEERPENVNWVGDNPMLDKTHVGEEKKVAEPTNAMEKATKSASLDKVAANEYRKAAAFAAAWTPGSPIVRQGSAAFEAGLYAGITANTANQAEWLAEHRKWATRDEGIAERIEMHAEFTDRLLREAATTTDLDTMLPGINPGGDNAPLQGVGEKPPLAGGMDPAAPGGASPYNGAEPFSKPVAPDPGVRTSAFQARVREGISALAAEPKNTPVCRGCGEAFESRKVATEAHGKSGCGKETGERGYEMKRESEAW